MLTNRAAHDERGAVAVVTALCLSAFLLVTSAMVVDLGVLRVDRQSDKAMADAAAMAGANGLVPDVNDPQIHPFAGVCQALAYLKANRSGFSTLTNEQWSDGAGTAVGAPDCSNLANPDSRTCSTVGDRTTWARFTAKSDDGRTSIAIQSGYDLSSAGADPLDAVAGGPYSEDSLPVYSGDSGAPDPADPNAVDLGGCENLVVIIGEDRDTTMGAQATEQISAWTRSVGRVTIAPPESPYALLILERHDCQVLVNGTNPTAKIDVQGYGEHPGLIHSDSDGTADSNGDGAPDNSSCNKAVLIGQRAGGVVAHEAPDTGAPGKISTVALSNQADSPLNVYSGPAPGSPPVSASQATRSIVDRVYLDGVHSAVTNSSPAWSAISSGSAPASSFGSAPGTWTVITGCPSGSVAGAKVFIKNCSNMNNNATFPDATDIIFPGKLGGGSSTIRMPKARNVFVFGDSSSNGSGVSTGTALSMHNDGVLDQCPSTYSGSGSRAKLMVYAGSLTVGGGSFQACGTTVILMSNRSDACLPATTPTYFSDDKPCGGGYGNGIVNFSGGASVDWTAPNMNDDQFQARQVDHDNLEDLALWDEAGGAQGIGGSGTVHLAGVFAAPNASPLKINGNPTWQVQNSQYVVRKLEDDGGGIFSLMPSPTLPVAPPTVTFNLVR